jgi:8-oxo-dGTP pyrophosphatase MutT (NUDIX family)
LHRGALKLYRYLPASVRRVIVRFAAPSYTVGAICLIERADGRVLLARQVYRARWGFPGGLLERGESPSAAVRREVREEVGLDVELRGEPATVVDPRTRRVDLVFRARPSDDGTADAARPSSPEITTVEWFSPDALPELQLETVQALMALARSGGSVPSIRPAIRPAS